MLFPMFTYFNTLLILNGGLLNGAKITNNIGSTGWLLSNGAEGHPKNVDLGEGCESIESGVDGIKLHCCSLNVPSASRSTLYCADCSKLCRTGKCKCFVTVNDQLNCELKTSQSWNQVLKTTCAHLRLPNADTAEFSVVIRHWSRKDIIELFNGFSRYKVTQLSIEIPSDRNSHDIAIPNLGLFFPQLRHFSLTSTFSELLRARLTTTTTFRDLFSLESIKIANFDFSLGKEEPLWLESIERIHVENSSLSELPRWLAKCHQLQRLTIRGTQLESAVVLSQIPSVVQINARQNRINDLHKVSFNCEHTHEIDVSHNLISRLASHTFSQCYRTLRILDISYNPIEELPNKAFFACSRLKYLRIRGTKIHALKADMFVGLSALKSLSLSENALEAIDPFTFLPVKSIRSLDLDRCNLTIIPLAVTHCCLLDSLSLNDNRLYGRESMPAEVLALLSKLSHISFERNPLMEMPYGFFLHPTDDESKLTDILDNLVQLPVWRSEPCTPFMWRLHLQNSTSAELRKRVQPWNAQRMLREQLAHCQQLYETIMDSIGLYRELVENSGCEASRKLRSVRDNHEKLCRDNGRLKNVLPISVMSPEVTMMNLTAEVDGKCSQIEPRWTLIKWILGVSLTGNLASIAILIGYFVLQQMCGRTENKDGEENRRKFLRIKRKEFEEI